MWNSLGSALDNFTKTACQNAAQLIHNWQHTGEQKKKFFTSTMENVDDSVREQTRSTCLDELKRGRINTFCDKVHSD